MSSPNYDWEQILRQPPDPVTAANLERTHGFEICHQRWSWYSKRRLWDYVYEGRRRLRERAKA